MSGGNAEPILGGNHMQASYKLLTQAHEDAEHDSDIEYLGICKKATDIHDMPNDVWGATLFVILKDIPDIMEGDIHWENMMRITIVFVLLTINIFLQMIFLFWIWMYVVQASVRQVQDDYRDYHATVFSRSGTFMQDHFDDFVHNESDICFLALSNTGFLCGILFLWLANCINELKVVYRRSKHFFSLPRLPAGRHPNDIVFQNDCGLEGAWADYYYLIVCSTPLFKCLIAVFVFIPKLFIAIVLAYLGCIWLAATESFSDMILNSLALGFVVNIDELIFTCFLPDRLSVNLGKTKLALQVPEHKHPDHKKEHELRHVKDAYLRAWFFLIATIAGVAIFMYAQPVLPGYSNDIQSHCREYMRRTMIPWCKSADDACFPFATGDHEANRPR